MDQGGVDACGSVVPGVGQKLGAGVYAHVLPAETTPGELPEQLPVSASQVQKASRTSQGIQNLLDPRLYAPSRNGELIRKALVESTIEIK